MTPGSTATLSAERRRRRNQLPLSRAVAGTRPGAPARPPTTHSAPMPPRASGPNTLRTCSRHQLLEPLHGMVVVHPRCTRRRAQGRSDLSVFAALLGPHQEDLALESRQRLQARPEPRLRVVRRCFLMRVGRIYDLVVLDRHHPPPSLPPVFVLEEVAGDAAEPAPERRLAPPAYPASGRPGRAPPAPGRRCRFGPPRNCTGSARRPRRAAGRSPPLHPHRPRARRLPGTRR